MAKCLEWTVPWELRQNWALWVWWVLANGVGGIFYMLTGMFEFIPLLLFGVITGVAQWLVLRHYIEHAGTWIIASFVGALIGMFVSVLVVALVGPALSAVAGSREAYAYNAVYHTVVGGSIGVAQWLVLQHHIQHTDWHHGGWWLLASTIGWIWFGTLGMAVSVAFAKVMPGFVETAILVGSIRGAGYGAITGIALVSLLRDRRAEA